MAYIQHCRPGAVTEQWDNDNGMSWNGELLHHQCFPRVDQTVQSSFTPDRNQPQSLVRMGKVMLLNCGLKLTEICGH